MRFVDTCIIAYAYDLSEGEKRDKCKKLVESGFYGDEELAVSNQILAELFSVLTKKIEKPISSENAKIIVDGIIESENWVKVDYNSQTVRKATVTVNEDSILQFWDVLIAETMIENKIKEIYTENTRDFEKIPGIRSINPML